MCDQLDMFETINTRNETPDKDIPEGANLKDYQRWCPYCSKPVIFIKDKERGIKKCPYCGISNRDYSVKMVNHKWLWYLEIIGLRLLTKFEKCDDIVVICFT